MLELDFNGIRIETVSSVEREIVVHPVGHAGRDYDHRAGIVLTWRDGMVALMTTRFFPDAGCYVTARLGTFPDRPFPRDEEEAVAVVKAVIRSFAAGLLAAYPEQAQYPACNGSGADLYQDGVGSCEACQGYGARMEEEDQDVTLWIGGHAFANLPPRARPTSIFEARTILTDALREFDPFLNCPNCGGSGAEDDTCKHCRYGVVDRRLITAQRPGHENPEDLRAEITRLGKLALQLLQEGEGGGAYFSPELARAAYQAAGETLPEYLKAEKD